MEIKRTCFVTGGHGFIGGHLVSYLREKGHAVVRVGRDLKLEGDITGSVIFHLGAYGNYADQINYDEMIYVNIGKLYRLLQILNPYPYHAFVNFSTSSVMLRKQTFYSATKASGEYIAKAHAHTFLKPIISIRPFTVIGPGEQKQHLIPRLIRSCLIGERMEFVNSSVHDYIDVRDLVPYVARKAFTIKSHERGNIFEVGSGTETTNEEVKKIVEELTGRKANTVERKMLRTYDTTKGWSAAQPIGRNYTLADSIRDMIDYEKQRKNTLNK